MLDRGLAVALGLAAIAAIVRLSHADMTVHGSEQAVLRLAWSARPERIENCRQQTAEELARLPAHMRQPVVCEGANAQYRLTVRSGGTLVADQVVRGGGLRQDRRLYVFHEIPLDPGDASIEVRFDRLDAAPPGLASTGNAGGQPGPPGGGEAIPPQMSFEGRLRIQPREVVLVTYSPETRALVAIRDPAAAAH